MDLYRRVRLACHHEGLSKREAARRFGIDRKTVDKILDHWEPFLLKDLIETVGIRAVRPIARSHARCVLTGLLRVARDGACKAERERERGLPILQLKDRLVLFVHIPKTGGSTIEHHLAEAGLLFMKTSGGWLKELPCSAHHFHATLLEALFASADFSYAFMVVRHPLTRILSEYRYRTRKSHRLRSRMSFSLWLRYALARRRLDSYYNDNHLRPQVEFETAGAEIFRWEDGIETCFVRVAEKIGIETPERVETLKKSAPRPVRVRESDIALVYRVYREDFECYGYPRVPEGFDNMRG